MTFRIALGRDENRQQLICTFHGAHLHLGMNPTVPRAASMAFRLLSIMWLRYIAESSMWSLSPAPSESFKQATALQASGFLWKCQRTEGRT